MTGPGVTIPPSALGLIPSTLICEENLPMLEDVGAKAACIQEKSARKNRAFGACDEGIPLIREETAAESSRNGTLRCHIAFRSV